MKPILFYDFETTGLPYWELPSSDPKQPHIVQAAAVLADPETRKDIASINLIVEPTFWEIPDDIAQIHGITTEHAAKVGIEETYVVDLLFELWQNAGHRVAYNEPFDARIMRIALKRNLSETSAEIWKAGKNECAMRLATDALNFGKYPKLADAYRAFTGQLLEDAHSAMSDVRAAMTIYWAIKDHDAADKIAEELEETEKQIELNHLGDSDVPFL